MITKVFRSGNSQAVRIPRELRLESGEVEIERRGDEIVIRQPRPQPRRLSQVFRGFSTDFFEDGRRQPPMQKRRGL